MDNSGKPETSAVNSQEERRDAMGWSGYAASQDLFEYSQFHQLSARKGKELRK
ncbi:hypothetical protein UY3_15161 [Chelonia mydas]|uniref:Uncharacterized protein n=1 Tax=Chelonia mydas TaxID=8469 RepID=M7ASX4_CHEMY|nr:hypothetical protein UY3_15161 [Chelonia mydas]